MKERWVVLVYWAIFNLFWWFGVWACVVEEATETPILLETEGAFLLLAVVVRLITRSIR